MLAVSFSVFSIKRGELIMRGKKKKTLFVGHFCADPAKTLFVGPGTLEARLRELGAGHYPLVQSCKKQAYFYTSLPSHTLTHSHTLSHTRTHPARGKMDKASAKAFFRGLGLLLVFSITRHEEKGLALGG